MYKPTIKSNIPKASRKKWRDLGVFYGDDRQSICIGTKGILWGEDIVKKYPFSQVESFQIDADKTDFINSIQEGNLLYTTQAWVRVNFTDGEWVTTAWSIKGPRTLALVEMFCNDLLDAGAKEGPEIKPNQENMDQLAKEGLMEAGFIN